ncbi:MULTISPECIES: radical SAM/CxCxxxxC motif protein YfkAB [unclassified Brevibacillus]|uniref:radical SAM/CxCxxxxC motif protein YfkAB n=1 Tax=unclassified Brevibacillus TaxID=2684853 RepID=UPI00156B8662|nr:MULTISPECIES: radical SAM/CxCxxxxC motif protein YfkAB [unclassified Brevibacillus]MDH6348907.1 radical SAM/CxCxxxxC motif protein YfkAB [Brevibacillus sp. 1238]NRQ51855.1 radical SAM/CxCxxxxC motif protein YfkAB [Brevibacillus sp. HD1.4A]UED71157.1 radical SAM/CxCxxxxC motif protein YfkAB [Brevibacillus sp. HD3.3A]
MIRMVPTTPLTPIHDPWEPLFNATPPAYKLTSVEFTVTNLCNLRCEHCAVGDTLRYKDDPALPVDLILRRLDEAKDLLTLSITGGEPMYSERTVKEVIQPILRYAADRGLRTQINSNMSMPFSRYELVLPYIDVMHISWNWSTPEEFHDIVYAKARQPVSGKQAEVQFERMMDNARKLAEAGVFVSAETMLNHRTWPKLETLHRQIQEMGSRRHEVHPMYASDFARDLDVLSLDELRQAIHRMLDVRNEDLWMLFGTLPFFACSADEADRALIQRLRTAKNVTTRNDPDGRNRLNINIFTGDVIVTDFGDVEPLGNIQKDELQRMFDTWQGHSMNQKINCFCPAAKCAGPNLLVANTYYPETNFTMRKALV